MNDTVDDGEPTEGGQDPLRTRRDAITKAAGAAAVAGAVWMAPRVEGLSVVPDYASAATLTGNVNVPANFNWAGPGPSLPLNQTDYWALVPQDSDNPGTTRTQVVSRVVPLPLHLPAPQGPLFTGASVSVSIAQNTQADQGASVPITVDFPGFDPPFNKLNAANLTFKGRNLNLPVSENGPHPGSIMPLISPSLPRPTASPITFTLPNTMNDVGPFPSSNTSWANLAFTFTFGP